MEEKSLSKKYRIELIIAAGFMFMSAIIGLVASIFSGLVVSAIESSTGWVNFFAINIVTAFFFGLIAGAFFIFKALSDGRESEYLKKSPRETLGYWRLIGLVTLSMVISYIIFLGMGGSWESVVVDIIHFWYWLGSLILVIFNHAISLF